jgi:WD40 repeat protein
VRAQTLPPALRERLVEPPLWISIASRRSALHRRPLEKKTRKELIGDFGQLFLRLYPGQTWEGLVGEERALRIKARRLVLAATLTVLLLAAFGGYEAIQTRRQGDVAASRALAARAEQMLDEDRSQALALAIRAWRTAKTPEARLSVAHAFPTLAYTVRGKTASLSRDGLRIITGATNSAAWIWNAADGRLIAELKGHTAEIEQTAFSPDGQWAATASDDHTARLWNAATGECAATLRGHLSEVYGLEFSPDGRFLVTAGEDGAALLWSVPDGRQVGAIRGHQKSILRVRYSPDGRYILTASEDGTAELWNTSDGKIAFTFSGHTGSIWDADFSRDGRKIVTASADKTALVWSAVNGQRLIKLQGHEDTLERAVFLPDGSRLVTAARDGVLRLWSTSGKLLFGFRASDATQSDKRVVNDLAISPDGSWVVTATADGFAKIWSTSTGELVSVLAGNGQSVDQALFSPDGRHLVSAGHGGETRVWNSAAAPVVLAFGDSKGYCSHGSFSPDGTRMLLSSCNPGNSRVVSTANGRVESFLERDGNPPVFSPDGTKILAGDTVMNGSGRVLFRLSGHTSSIFDSEFSPDGSLIVTASRDKTARVWDAHTGRAIATLPHADRVTVASFSINNRFVITAGRDGAATLWNVETGQKVRTLEAQSIPIRCVALSPDGQRIVTEGDEGKANVWAISGGPPMTLAGHTGSVRHAAFSPDGRMLVTTGDREGLLWRVADYRLVAKFDGSKGGGVSSIEFSRDGKRILMTTLTYKASLYDTDSGALITAIEGSQHDLLHAFISPDGLHIVTLNRDRSAFVHRIWMMHELVELLRN